MYKWLFVVIEKLSENTNLNLFSPFGITTENHPLYSSARVSMLTRAHGFTFKYFGKITVMRITYTQSFNKMTWPFTLSLFEPRRT